MSRPSSTLADYVRAPRNAGAMEAPDAVGKASLNGRAPRLTIYVKTDGATVARATFGRLPTQVQLSSGARVTMAYHSDNRPVRKEA